VISDRLRIGESPGARLAGQLCSNERERLLGEIVGQLGRNARGLDKVPPMHEQIRDAPLQPLGAGGHAQISHVPLRTRGRRHPLAGSYPVDHVARNCG
jgi:hypothetical protein